MKLLKFVLVVISTVPFLIVGMCFPSQLRVFISVLCLPNASMCRPGPALWKNTSWPSLEHHFKPSPVKSSLSIK